MQHLRCFDWSFVMAKPTIASLTAKVAALEAALAGLEQERGKLQRQVNHLFAENRARNPQATATKRPFSERAKAYMAATGERSVTMPKLMAWEQAHA